MQAGEPSKTAMMAAVVRGRHRLVDRQPWIFDDPYALSLVGPAWEAMQAALTATFRTPLQQQTMVMSVVTRSRYAEDHLLKGQFFQYVSLGAGLDSFAWRRPDALGSIRVFEIDHPATQAWKRERVAALTLPSNDNHVFAPIDLATESLADGLTVAGFDWYRPAMFSWLGVTPYLTSDSIRATLNVVTACAPGSEIVVSYAPPPAYLDDLGQEFMAMWTQMAAQRGEPLVSRPSPAEAEALIQGCGLKISQHPTLDDLHGWYFAGRSDGLMPPTLERYIAAVVPG